MEHDEDDRCEDNVQYEMMKDELEEKIKKLETENKELKMVIKGVIKLLGDYI